MKKILVVDDLKKDLKLMRSILEKAGYEIVTAQNGSEAIEALETDNIDLILLDILMPTVSGYDLLIILKERYNHGTPMLYVSIVPEKEVDMTNIDGFIQKPFSEKDFLKQVKKALKTKKRNKKNG